MAGQGEAHPEQEAPDDRSGSSGIAQPGYRKSSGAKPLLSMILCKLRNQENNMGWSGWEEFRNLNPNDKTNLQEQKALRLLKQVPTDLLQNDIQWGNETNSRRGHAVFAQVWRDMLVMWERGG